MPTETELTVVQIDDVDMTLRRALGTTNQQNILNVYFREYPGGMLLIPEQGELWLVVRRGWDWYLEKRLDNDEEHEEMLAKMGPGDMRLSAQNTMYTRAGSLYFNDRELGTAVRDTFHADDPFSEVTLTHSAVSSETISPQLNGVLIPRPEWVYDSDDRKISFRTPLGEAGFLTVEYQTWMKSNDDAGMVTGRADIQAVEVFEDN